MSECLCVRMWEMREERRNKTFATWKSFRFGEWLEMLFAFACEVCCGKWNVCDKWISLRITRSLLFFHLQLNMSSSHWHRNDRKVKYWSRFAVLRTWKKFHRKLYIRDTWLKLKSTEIFKFSKLVSVMCKS